MQQSSPVEVFMILKYRSKAIEKVLILLILILIVHCASTINTPIRLYNLQSGKIIYAYLAEVLDNRGTIISTLSNGENLTGEYAIADKMYGYEQSYRNKFSKNGYEAVYKDDIEKGVNETKSWARVYGFGQDSKATPVATAILVGNEGTVIEIVFYTLNIDKGFGDGIGKDNQGNWFRVYVGELNHQSLR